MPRFRAPASARRLAGPGTPPAEAAAAPFERVRLNLFGLRDARLTPDKKERRTHVKRTPLGDTGLSVSEICLGTMTFGQQNSLAEAH